MIYIFPSRIDLIWCPVQCVCLGLYPPTSTFPNAHTYTMKHTHRHFPSAAVSQIAHWFPMHVLVLKFLKGDRQLLLLPSEAITTLPRGRLPNCHSPSQQSFKRVRKCILWCKIPNRHTGGARRYFITQTHNNRSNIKCSLPSAYVTWWGGWAQAAEKHFYRNRKRKEEKLRNSRSRCIP